MVSQEQTILKVQIILPEDQLEIQLIIKGPRFGLELGKYCTNTVPRHRAV